MIGQPCRSCREPIILLEKGEDERPRGHIPLDADPADRAVIHDASAFRVVSGIFAYRPAHLEQLWMFNMGWPPERAHSEAIELPWHRVHRCEAGR